MTLRKGDKVKFLNDIGGGIVTRVEHKMIYVENEDGFEVPATEPELLKIEVSPSEATPFTTTIRQATADIPLETFVPEPEEATDYIDLSGTLEDSNIDTAVNLLLAWTVRHKKNGNTVYDLYLINDCSYHIMYVSAMVKEGAYHGIQAGVLENDTTIHLTEILAGELKHITSIRIESLFFKKGIFMPQEPMRYELKIDEFYVTDAMNYVTNEYFDEKALVYNISEEFLLSEIENVAWEVQAQFEKQKKHIDAPKPKFVTKKEPDEDKEEVDLHIEQLVDNAKELSSAEMLDIQMARFHTSLEGALRNRQKRIVFIHGVGNGRLKLEIRRTLDQKYPRLRYQDASFKEYGYGATLVFL